MAGMDGNRTHPGRLNSAPQTVLKTAEDTSPRSSPASRIPILAVSPTKQGCDRSRKSMALQETTPHVFEDRGSGIHRLP